MTPLELTLSGFYTRVDMEKIAVHLAIQNIDLTDLHTRNTVCSYHWFTVADNICRSE
jgi:hypothetical protein